MFKKSLDYGQAGDNIGVLLRGVKREDVTRGQILTQPNTVKTYKKFTVRPVQVLLAVLLIIPLPSRTIPFRISYWLPANYVQFTD